MGFRLTPVDATFFDLVAGAATLLVEGSRELADLLGAPPEERAAIAERMADIEHRADEGTHELLRRVGKSFVPPFDRRDIHALAAALDDCMDLLESAADLIVRYRLHVLPEGVASQVNVLARMAELTAAAMPALRDVRRLGDYLIEVNRLENQANREHRALLAAILDDENAPPLHAIKVKHVVDELEACANAFERVAHVVEGISLHET